MTEAPLTRAWLAAQARNAHAMQIPGHKGLYRHGHDAIGADLLGPLVRDDISMQGGVDDNSYSRGYLAQAEELWAQAIGGDHARFLVGGSTQGNISALTTVGRPNRPLVMDRTSHRSVQAALVVSGATPIWIYPTIHPEFGIPVGMPVSSLASIPADATAVFLTSPSYVGSISNVAALAEAVHAHGIPLIVDQAWGAHLDFLPGRGAIANGADLAITSVHKALMGYTQTATITMRDGLITRADLDRCVDLVGTTSPSGTLLASIDATRAVLQRAGASAFDDVIEAVAQARRELARIVGVVVLDDANAGCALDPLKLTLWLPRTGVVGSDLAERLWGMGHGAETADQDTLVLTFTVADPPSFVAEMTGVLTNLIDSMRGSARDASPTAVWRVEPDVAMTPRDAYFAPRRRMALADAAGEISAEQFTPYPPGVPLIAPGERVTPELIEAVQIAGRTGRVAYCSDPTLATIEVVA
jgi:arginine decarboxylase